jgi:two-component system, LytTR family, sensor kinase
MVSYSIPASWGCTWATIIAMNQTSAHSRPVPWLGIAALWLCIGLIDACQTVFPMRAQGMHHAWVALFVMLVAAWLPWALATPIVMNLARRYPLFHAPSAAGLLSHAAMLLAISLVTAAWYALFEFELNPWALAVRSDSYLNLMLAKLVYSALTSLIAYGLILTITEFISSQERAARSHAEAADLRARLSEAQLAALRQQMDPHFTFNTLNAICGLVRDDQNEAAVRMLLGLSEFLRHAAERSHLPLVTLAEEVKYLERYLDIQKCRFGDRLQVVVDVPQELLAARVPNLLLQPLAENAIKHGISKRAEGGTIWVTGSSANNHIHLNVRNTGPRAASKVPGKRPGIGLSNLRARMQRLYGSDFELKLQQTENGDVEVRIALPLREDVVSVPG